MQARRSKLVRLGLLAIAPLLMGATLLPIGGPIEVAPDAAWEYRPGVAVDAAGNFVVVWAGLNADRTAGGIFGRRFERSGAPLGPAFQVNVAAYNERAPAVAMDGAGTFVIAWSRDGLGADEGVYGRRFDASGAPLGSEFKISPGYDTSVASDVAGNFTVVWKEWETDVVAGRRYDSTGTALGAAFSIGTTTGIGTGQRPQVTADASGNVLVVWLSLGTGIVGRRYDPSGAPLGGAFAIAGGESPWAAFASDGNFMAGASLPLLARRYGVDGAPIGSAFAVNVDPANGTPPYGVASVAADADGNFLLAWETGGLSLMTYWIMGRRYDAAGTPQGPEFSIGNPGYKPAVAAGPSGAFVVVYTAGRVYAQRFGFEAPISGARIVIADSPTPTRRRIVLRSVDPGLSTQPGAGIDPVAHGAFLHVFGSGDTDDSACLALPAGGWSVSGDPARPAFRYADGASTNGPCKTVTIKPSLHGQLFKAVCRGSSTPIDYSLDESQQGHVAFRLISGPATYCGLFGGTVLRDSGTRGRFTAKNAPAPVSCPVPPVACP